MRSSAMTVAYKARVPIWFLLFFATVFFFSSHNLYFSLEENFDRPPEYFEEKTMEGSLPRRIAFLSLGVFGLIGITRKRFGNLRMQGTLPWLLVLFAAWSMMSICWSIDMMLTVRRLFVFVIFCLSALAVVRLFPIHFLEICALFITSTYLLLGLSAEIALGTLNPLATGYRFAGTSHPNVQGMNCAIMLMASIALGGSAGRGRIGFWFCACVALIGLILTKSRTSFGGALLAVSAFWLFGAAKSKGSVMVILAGWLFCLLFILFGENVVSIAKQGVLLGRDSGDFSTFTGRTLIWETCLDYFVLRPVHGYGFNSFWTPNHIGEFAQVVGIGIIGAHSAYFDLLLNVGLVGFIICVFILTLGIRCAFTRCRKGREKGYGFLLMLLVFSATHGLLESAVMQMSSFATFLLICGLLYLALGYPSSEAAHEAF